MQHKLRQGNNTKTFCYEESVWRATRLAALAEKKGTRSVWMTAANTHLTTYAKSNMQKRTEQKKQSHKRKKKRLEDEEATNKHGRRGN